MFKKIQRRFSHAQTLAIGHFLVILMGALLLMLPISSRSGTSTDFLSSLFTSTSATCVTGLVVVDTGTHWNFFGQLVIITLIQIGGLGFVTMGVLFSMFLNKKISYELVACCRIVLTLIRSAVLSDWSKSLDGYFDY